MESIALRLLLLQLGVDSRSDLRQRLKSLLGLLPILAVGIDGDFIRLGRRRHILHETGLLQGHGVDDGYLPGKLRSSSC